MHNTPLITATSKEPTEEHPRIGRPSRRPSGLLTKSRTASTARSLSATPSFAHQVSESETSPPEPSKFDQLQREAKATSDEHYLLWDEHKRQIDTLIDNLIEIGIKFDRNRPEKTAGLKELARKRHATLELHDELVTSSTHDFSRQPLPITNSGKPFSWAPQNTRNIQTGKQHTKKNSTDYMKDSDRSNTTPKKPYGPGRTTSRNYTRRIPYDLQHQLDNF